jgi:hypothetical protein
VTPPAIWLRIAAWAAGGLAAWLAADRIHARHTRNKDRT